MTIHTPHLTIGIVDFDEPTLLIVGDSAGLLWLAKLIESAWTGSFSTLPDKVHLAGIELDIVHSGPAGGLAKSGTRLLWRLSDDSLKEYPQQLRALALTSRAGHAYLDAPLGSPTIQVVASKEEYDPAVLFNA